MREYIDGEIVVRFHNDVDSNEAEKVITDFGLSVKDKISSIYLIGVPVGSEQKWADSFKKLALVRFAERNGVAYLSKSRNHTQ